MLDSQKKGVDLYENLGRLFYAIAKVDGIVHDKEVGKLKAFIGKYWLDVDVVEDEFGTDAAFRIKAVFDWMLHNKKDGEECFEKFQEFYKINREKFTPFIKVLILDTAHAMANAYAGKNKAELILLTKLELLLK